MSHNERCKKCKINVSELLTKLCSEVKVNYNLQLANKPEFFINNSYYPALLKIFTLLQNSRGYKEFVRSKQLPNVDFFVVNPGFIVEFDETQHFTKQRMLALLNYPHDLPLGFDKQEWIERCMTLRKKDNDPPFRDEQRAWYDTVRDFAPVILNLNPTVRLFSKDLIWCELNPEDMRAHLRDKFGGSVLSTHI